MREKIFGSITTKKDIAFWKKLGATTDDIRRVNEDVVNYQKFLQDSTHPRAESFALQRKLLLFQELDLRADTPTPQN